MPELMPYLSKQVQSIKESTSPCCNKCWWHPPHETNVWNSNQLTIGCHHMYTTWKPNTYLIMPTKGGEPKRH